MTTEVRKNSSVRNSKVKEMVYASLFAVVIAVCSWISIPGPVPFTLQTMAVFTAVGLLGGKLGTMSILIYILLGAVGLPVFSGFTGGIGVLLGATGGYIAGFILSALLMWAMEKIKGNRKVILLVSMFLGLIVCYAAGTLWFMHVYIKTTGPVTLMSVLGWCVFPFIIPDTVKILIAYFLTNRLKKFV